MKCELKRPVTTNFLISVGFVFFGVLCLVISSEGEALVFGTSFMFGGVVMAIYEFFRSKAPKLIFDKNSFWIGDRQYSYSDIEKVKSRRTRFSRYNKIIIAGKTVYKFDNSYENIGEFVKQLTLHSIDHNLL